MIKRIEIKGKLAQRIPAFKDNAVFEFKPGLNLLVGLNGTGKSTILRAIRDQMIGNSRSSAEITVEYEGDFQTLYFSGEENGSRLKGAFDDNTDMMHQISAIFASRGQAMGSYIIQFLNKYTPAIRTGAVVLLDEPDSSIDWPNIASLPKLMAQVPQTQFIVACHHPILVLQPANVIELTPHYCKGLRAALIRMLGLEK